MKEKEVKENTAPNIAELRVAGKCFKYREPWVSSHAKVFKGKQVYYVILVEDAQGKEEVAVVEDATNSEDGEYHDAQPHQVATVSMHALCGTLTASTTFTLKLHIGHHIATALVDTGSDISFINAKFAVKIKCHISNVSTVQVAAANGSNMFSNSTCLNCNYTIQGHSFSSDFRLLEVKGYDVILGAVWIHQHSPVGLNLKSR